MINNSMTNQNSFTPTIDNASNRIQINRPRIGTSATEIELFDDLPLTQRTTQLDQNQNFSSKQQATENPFRTISYHETLSPRTDHRSPNDVEDFDTAVDKLLQKYAPDAIPKNVVITSAERRPISTNNNSYSTTNNRHSTTGPRTNVDSHVYATITRTNRDQVLTSNDAERTAIENDQQTSNRFARTQIEPTYDNFHHVSQPSQTAKPTNNKPISSMYSKTSPPKASSKSAARHHTTHLIEGQWHTIDQDPLDIFYEREKPVMDPKQEMISTFQPSNISAQQNDPLTMILSSFSTNYKPSQIDTKMNQNVDPTQSFDLANVIRNVQQDYLRQIQPYVSSVKIIDRDKLFGEQLSDVNFVTPVSMRKGFKNQAEDLLKQSLGRNFTVEDPIGDHTTAYADSSIHNVDIGVQVSMSPQALVKDDSGHTISSLTSISSTNSDFDTSLHESPGENNLSHSPGKQTNPMTKQTTNGEKKDESLNNSTVRTVTKARRVPSDELSITTSDSSVSIDESNSKKMQPRSILAEYNEHELGDAQSRATSIRTNNIIYEKLESHNNSEVVKKNSNDDKQHTPISSSNKRLIEQPIVFTQNRDSDKADDSESAKTIMSDSEPETPPIGKPQPTTNTATISSGARSRTEQTGQTSSMSPTSAPKPNNTGRFRTDQIGSATTTAPSAMGNTTNHTDRSNTNSSTPILQSRSPPTTTARAVTKQNSDSTPPRAFKDIQQTPEIITRNNRQETVPTTTRQTNVNVATPVTTNRIAVSEPSGSSRLFGSNPKAPPPSNLKRENSKSFRNPFKSLKSMFHRS